MLDSWLPLVIISAITVTIELLLFKHVLKKYPETSTDMIVWLYRIVSIGFISLYLVWQFYNSKDKSEYMAQTLYMDRTGWLIIIMGFFSALSIVAYFQAIEKAPHVGLPVAIRAAYIPLTFIGGFLFLGDKWSNTHLITKVGMAVITAGIVLVGYGSMNFADAGAT